MAIGYLGEIVFEVNNDKILTPRDMGYSKEAKWAEHETLVVKTKSEFLGDGKKNYNMSIKLSAYMGVNPQKELDKIEEIISNGLIEPLFIGSKHMGDYYIKSMSVKIDNLDNKGSILGCTVDLTLVEFVNEKLADVKKRIETAQKKQREK